MMEFLAYDNKGNIFVVICYEQALCVIISVMIWLDQFEEDLLRFCPVV